ncbi:MAG: hypothetical protein ABSH25_12425 [Syntrophorhabdales bacterium]
MSLNERTHFVSVVNGAMGHFHRGDHFMESIDRPVRFVPDLWLSA